MSPREPKLEEAGRLSAYGRLAFERAEDFALRLHAEELTPEHVLVAILEDEECAATRLVLHAFADPETLAAEVVALCPGIMVVGSARSLPFSMLGVRALEEARTQAAAGGAPGVLPAHILSAGHAQLEGELRQSLADAGLHISTAPAEATANEDRVPSEGPLFKHFSNPARRALGAAARTAGSLGRAAIGPAHLLIGCLETDDELAREIALSPSRARMVLAGRDEDPTPLPERRVPPDARLGELLARLPQGAGTMELFGDVLRQGSEEVRALLRRQKVTDALFERAHAAFEDPEPPSGMAR